MILWDVHGTFQSYKTVYKRIETTGKKSVQTQIQSKATLNSIII